MRIKNRFLAPNVKVCAMSVVRYKVITFLRHGAQIALDINSFGKVCIGNPESIAQLSPRWTKLSTTVNN